MTEDAAVRGSAPDFSETDSGSEAVRVPTNPPRPSSDVAPKPQSNAGEPAAAGTSASAAAGAGGQAGALAGGAVSTAGAGGGAAGRPAAAGEPAAGAAAMSCMKSLVLCGGSCVDVKKDAANCGECGLVCHDGECKGGKCHEGKEDDDKDG